MKKSVTTILDFNFVNSSFAEFLNLLEERINEHQNTFVVTANPEITYYAHTHIKFKKMLQSADYITPDGIGIVKAAHILNQPMTERISGYDLFVELLKWGNQNHKSVYFIGSKPKVINDLKKVINKMFPNLKVAGYQDGYFKDEQPVATKIKETHPDMVFVALGSPKQEEFIKRHQSIDTALWMGLGGSFDVLSGNSKRAPKFWVNNHIEWLYRLLKEPSRFKRVFKILPFLKLIYQQKHKQK